MQVGVVKVDVCSVSVCASGCGQSRSNLWLYLDLICSHI